LKRLTHSRASIFWPEASQCHEAPQELPAAWLGLLAHAAQAALWSWQAPQAGTGLAQTAGQLHWDAALTRLLGAGQWQHPADLLAPACRSDLMVALERAQAADAVIELETFAQTSAGTKVPVRMLMRRSPSGNRSIWLGVLQDRREHRLQLQEARQLRMQLGTTLASMTEAFATLDHEGRVSYANEPACQLLACSRDQLLGQRLWSEPAEQAVAAGERLQQACRHALDNGEPAEFETFVQALDKWIEVRLYPFDEGLALHLHDVSQRHQIQEQLLLLHTCIARLNDTVLITEQRSGQPARIVFVNQAFSRLTGYASQEVIGRHPSLLEGPLTQADALDRIAHAMGRWQAVRSELIHYKKNGEIFWVELEVVPIDESPRGICHWVTVGRDITARKAQDDAIEHLAFYDPLTDLPNRQLLMRRLEAALSQTSARKAVGALMFIDLDHFKLLNDTLGHDRGDLLLQQVAERLRRCVRPGDTVARLGGDEFVVVTLDPHEGQAAGQRARQMAQTILGALAQPYELAGQPYHGTCSIGVTLLHDHAQGLADWLKQADLAMYQAKAAGRNTLCFFDPQMQAAASAKAALTAALREGLRERQFVLHYQPQVQASGCIIGAEALLRWAHPDGLRGPDSFIAQAEESGLILPLGQWVLEQACEQLARWSTQPGRCDLRLSINVSARQFLQPQFVEQVLQCVAHHQIDPRRLELEITESLLATDLAGTIARMKALRQAGLGLAIDDFGMGYSALSCLKHMPLQRLKIDRSFVQDMIEDPRDAAIARTIIELAADLGLQVLAEGVETRAQRDLLSRLGCQAYQGFVFSPALPIEQFESLLAHWRPSEHRSAQARPSGPRRASGRSQRVSPAPQRPGGAGAAQSGRHRQGGPRS
jgi:diguanylate cyclase (GGDEF)-like protein/PAS domain S-box-containing protein